MKVEYILHKNISEKSLLDIIKVKTVAWPFSIEKQLEWINSYIKNEDIHVLIKDENEITAYLNLITIKIKIDDVEYNAFGIGNVCALKKGNGDGGKLISDVNKYLLHNKKIGLLFCNTKLVSFYKHMGWEIVPKNSIVIKDIGLNTNTLKFNFDKAFNKLIFEGPLF